nr:polycystin family receptor for egg jelly-like [Anolis sagrei ordinatus]
MQNLFHHIFLFCSFSCLYYQVAAPLHFLPPPLLVTCSEPRNRVYQRQDNALRISCLWDGFIVMHYSRIPGVKSGEEESVFQPPPYCRWFRNSILVNSTNLWSGNLTLGPGLPGDSPHPPWAYSQITVQCTSAFCSPPLCFHRNLSIEVCGQDVRLFLFWPRTRPILEWQPVHLGWCARLKSSTWIYHFRSQGGSPADLLIPSDQHTELPPSVAYLNAELQQVCRSYYSYHLTVRYSHRGFYTASVTIEHGPQVSVSTDFLVESALLHVFSANSTLLSHPHGTFNLSWSFQQLSQGIVAYKLLNIHDTKGWSHSYSYNPFALHSNFCAVHKPQQSKEKVVAIIYFQTNERSFGELSGKLDFSNQTLIFNVNNAVPTYLTINPQKVKIGTYIVSHNTGLYYSMEDGATNKNSSSHYIFYQQAGFSYLVIVEFVQLQLFSFSTHIYLNRKGRLFKSLREKEIEIHVFNSTFPDENLVYIVWFIPVQHPLLQCKWLFNLQLLDSKDKNEVQNYSFAYRNYVKNATQFIPDSVLPFNPALYTGFVAKMKCISSRFVLMVLKATFNLYSSKVIESRLACHQKACSITKINIQRSETSKFILHYAPGMEFTLAAETLINCPGPKQTEVIWNIYKVQNRTSTPDWSKPFNPPGIRRRNDMTLNIPSSSLDDGLYVFNFSMKLKSLDTWDITKSSDSVLVEIGPDNLMAAIAGGNFRSVSFSDQWILNGSVFSNGEVIQSFQKGLSFIWYCTKHKSDYASMTLSRNGKCHPDQVDLKWTTSSDPVQTVRPKTLQGSNTYYFLLMVQYGSRTARAEQAIYVHIHSTLILNVTCLENCDKSLVPTERFCLSGKCLNCRTNKPSYHWSLHSAQSNEIDFDWSSKTTTGRSSPYLRINAFAFETMIEHSYVLTLKVSTTEGQLAIYKYSFYVNGPPQLGKCVLNPKIGIAFLTKFIIQCNGFGDKNEPLAYKVIAAYNQIEMSTISSIENNTLGIIVYSGHDYKTPQFFLPNGVPSHNSALVIYVQVYDALGASSQVTLQATVHDEKKSKSLGVIHHELHSLMNGQSALMTTFRITKDYFDIGYFVYMVASVLNNIENPSQGSTSDLRQILLNMTAEMPTNTAQEINQVILSICQVTHETTEINEESQLLAIKKLKEASKALKRLKDKDFSSKETDILGRGILIGLSNVLKASLSHYQKVNINVIKETIFVMEILADLVLRDKVPGENETVMKTENWSVHLQKYAKADLFGNVSNRKDCKNCFYPKLKEGLHAELNVDAVVTSVFYVFDINPFPWLLFTEDIGTIVTGFKMTGTQPNGDIISLTPDLVEIIMARKDEVIFDLTIGPDKTLSKTTGGFSFEIKRSTKDVFIQIVSKRNITFQVFIYLGHNISHPPLATYTVSHHSPPTPTENDTTIPDCAVVAPYILCLPQSLLWSPIYSNREDKVSISIVLQSHPFVREQTTKIVRIALFAAECLDLDGIEKQWEEGTCSLGPETSWSKIHCICKPKGLDMITGSPRTAGTSETGLRFLASKVFSFPNHKDMKRSLLTHDVHYPIAELTLFIIFILYTLMAAWVLTKDKVGTEDQIIDLPDNDPFDMIKYLVTIYTGSRLRAGTRAGVFIELMGENGASGVHHLKHPHFPRTFRRGSIDTFLLTTMIDLGDISSLHIWHNNCSFGPNWYLSRVKVQNLETEETWLFWCRKWLSLRKNGCQIERTFAVTNPSRRVSKIDCFLITVSNDVSGNHLWLSVFTYHRIHGSLSRFQRLSCCLVILLTSLMFNSLLFASEKDRFILSVDLSYLRSIGTGIAGALISIPVQVILTTLFKHSQKRPAPSHPTQSQQKKRPSLVAEYLCTEDNVREAPLAEMTSQPFPPTNANVNNNYPVETTVQCKNTKNPNPNHWSAVTAWSLVLCIPGMSAFFIIVHGLSFGYITSLEWLLASVTSLCVHVFLFETLQILVISAWRTGFAKYCRDLPWQSHQVIHFKSKTQTASEMKLLHHELTILRASEDYQPLKKEVVRKLRRIHRIKHLAYVYVKNMFCHLFFLSLILTVAKPAEITTLYYSNQYMTETFSVDLAEVTTIEDIYTWVKNVFLPMIHNDNEPTYLSGTWFKILGLPRMRQIRSQSSPTKCFFPYGLTNTLSLNDIHCRKKYGIDPEDQADYLGSWSVKANRPIPIDNRAFFGFIYEHPAYQWDYYSYGKFNTYSSRGYSFYFFPGETQNNSTTRLETLEINKWLDDKTWALIIELTTFNPDTDLYCCISVIFEFSYIGPIVSKVYVESCHLPLLTDQSSSEVFFLLATVYMLITYITDECWMIYKQRLKYIKAATNLINFGMKTLCTIYVMLLLYKFHLAEELVQFYFLNPYQFIPFHVASQFDETVRIVMAFLLFLLILKMFRYFRFIYGVRLAQKSLHEALPKMINLSFAGAIFFFGFMSLGYLAFGQHEVTFRTLLDSFTTVLSYCALAFRDTEFSSDKLLGGLFLGCFQFVMICVFVNLSEVIIISAHVDMKETVYELPSHEAEVIYYLVQRIHRLCFFLSTGTKPEKETNFLNRILYGKMEKHNKRQTKRQSM